MAEVTFNLAAAFGVQSVLGTADATIKALAGSLVEADGLVLGDPDSGEGESGIIWKTNRGLTEKAVVSGSFTRPASNFVKEEIESFSITFPLKGRGTASPAADQDYTPQKGIDALLKSCGFTGAGWGGGLGWIYSPSTAQIITAKIWVAGQAWVAMDLVGSAVFDFPPGEEATVTVTLQGSIESFALATFPTLNYGNQASLSAPIVQTVGHNWGISAAARGFSEMSLTVDSETEAIEDSNAIGGTRSRQTGRSIVAEGVIFGESADIDFERTELVRTTAPTELQTWTVGTAGGSTANALRVRMPTPELRALEVKRLGVSYAIGVTLQGVNAAANGELELIYL